MAFKTLFMLCIFSCFIDAQVFTELGRFGSKGRLNGEFNNPNSIAVSKDNTLFIVDTDNHRIQLFNYSGNFIKSIGGFGFKDDQFDSPRDIWVNSLINIYVSDYNNQRIQRYDRDMNFINSFQNNRGEEIDFQFSEIASCLVTSQNDLFVLDHGEYKVVKFKRDGTAERTFGQFESRGGELSHPHQLELWSFDKLLISDPEKRTVYIYDLFGNFIQKIENPAFKYPSGIEVDINNNIYIADPDAKKVFIVDNSLKKVMQIHFLLDLQSPKDVVLTTINKKEYLYIIDGNEVIFGTLSAIKSSDGK